MARTRRFRAMAPAASQPTFAHRKRKRELPFRPVPDLKTCVLTAEVNLKTANPNTSLKSKWAKPLSELKSAVKVAAGEVRGIPVSMGNPHYVFWSPDFADELAKRRPRHSAQLLSSRTGVNVEMVVIDGKHDMRVRFFERGVGETQSSGTGSCASAVAAISTGKVNRPCTFMLPAASQMVRQDGKHVFLRGAARLVCRESFF